MFRKIVSNLSFSPALITQVGFYARRLRQEDVTRRTTVVFVVLALIVQSLTILSPPDSANASSEQDLLRGGIKNLDDLIAKYDKNIDDIKDIYTTLGLERSEIIAAKPGSFNSKNDIYSISRYGQYSTEQGETSFAYKRSAGGEGIRFVSPLNLSDTSAAKIRNGTQYEAWIGESTRLGWFAIMKSNASIATQGYPTTITPTASTAISPIVKTIVAKNLSQNTAGDAVTARPFDKISYTITAKNTGAKVVQIPLAINISDAVEYATLIDDGGGTFQPDSKNITWDTILIPPNESQERTFTLQLFSTPPAMPTGTSNANSYDCIISTTFGSNSKIPVECPAAKLFENIIGDFPAVGIFINGFFSMILVATVVYFYLRTRQMKKEIRLIRHNINTGTI